MKSGVTTSQEEQRQFRGLKDELARLSGLIESSKKRHESYVVDKAEETRLTASLVELRKEEHKLADVARAKELADAEDKRAKGCRTEAAKAQRDVSDAQDKLSGVLKDIEAAEKRKGNIVIDTEEESRLRVSLDTLRKDIERLTPEADVLKTSVKDSKGQLTKISQDTKKEKAEYERISELRTVQSTAFKQENDIYESVKSKHGDVSDSLKTVIAEAHKSIAAETQSARDELTSIKTDLGKGKKEIADMESERTKAKELAEENRDALRTLKKTEQAIAEKERTLKEKLLTEADLDKKLKDKQTAFDLQCAKKSDDLDAREKDLKEREGKINRTVEWIKYRAGLLQQAKTEIENYHGHQLSHIIIPDVKDLE